MASPWEYQVTDSTSTPPGPAPLRSQARRALDVARRRSIEAGGLPPAAADDEAPPVEVERPADVRHGDLASNLAMKLARPCRMPPLAIATAVARELERVIAEDPAATPLAAVDVAPPGFINLRLADHALEATIDQVLLDP